MSTEMMKIANLESGRCYAFLLYSVSSGVISLEKLNDTVRTLLPMFETFVEKIAAFSASIVIKSTVNISTFILIVHINFFH